MKRGLLVAVLAIGFIFAGVLSASAGTINWTMVETAAMAKRLPGGDLLMGTGDDLLNATNCNYSDATSCLTTGNPTTGGYSFAKLNFVQASSCALGSSKGAPCTQNSDCLGLGVCVDCNSAATPPGLAWAHFAANPSGGSKGLGNMTMSACDNGATVTNMSIGTSEVVGTDGGGCMTLASAVTTSGCGVGASSTTNNMTLWTSTLPGCGFNAGTMPNIALSGQILAAPTGGAVCGYTAPETAAIMTDAGLGAGSYLMVICGSGTLPTTLAAGCLPGAAWDTKLVASTSTSLPTSCGEACSSGGCMAGTAEGVE